MKFLTFTLPLILALSCSHQKEIKQAHIVAGSCEEQFRDTKLKEGQTIWKSVKEGTGTGISYLITGLGHSTDFIVSFTGGAIAGVGLCSPLIALDLLADNHGPYTYDISGDCIGEVGVATGHAINPKLGEKFSHGTEKWRCPDLEPMAEGLLSVADCYSQKGQKDLAKIQLLKIADSHIFKLCLPKDKMAKIKALAEAP